MDKCIHDSTVWHSFTPRNRMWPAPWKPLYLSHSPSGINAVLALRAEISFACVCTSLNNRGLPVCTLQCQSVLLSILLVRFISTVQLLIDPVCGSVLVCAPILLLVDIRVIPRWGRFIVLLWTSEHVSWCSVNIIHSVGYRPRSGIVGLWSILFYTF